jgi:hypothetical protein
MITDFGHVLGNPAWQGVGALIGLGSVAAYLWFEVRRRGGYRWRRSTGPLELFDMSTDDGEQRFYQRLVECVRDAQEAIYRSGHGFSRPGREAFYRALLGSEEDALRRGVEMTRIQTGPRVLAGWANGYAEPVDAYTYVPLQRSEGPDELPAGSSLDLLIEGATENNLTDLLASLRRTRSRGIR